MKILAIGDFHGKFSDKDFNKLKKLDFDLILSVGDFCGNEKLGKLFFKYWYGKSKEEIKKIPKRVKEEVKILEKKSVRDGMIVLNKLKQFNKPFYTVLGNWDPIGWELDIGADKDEYKTKNWKKFKKLFYRGFEFIDFKIRDLGNLVIVGGTSSTSSGKIDKKSVQKFIKKNKSKEPKEIRKYLSKMKNDYKKREKKYISLFLKAKKLRKPIVFLTHNSPYWILDKITSKKASKISRGKHYGSYLERLMINRFNPDLVICGHMHENFGKDKIRKTLVVNIGSFHDKKFALIDFPETKQLKINLNQL